MRHGLFRLPQGFGNIFPFFVGLVWVGVVSLKCRPLLGFFGFESHFFSLVVLPEQVRQCAKTTLGKDNFVLRRRVWGSACMFFCLGKVVQNVRFPKGKNKKADSP